ncbi:MAG TPA: asparagine synthase (glutamine-hydrolyzing) [Gemmatirosa sp.]|nr:asparagine synthase (glutamine-hydrolyzing) [Gemmatirosa sp.]
MCGIGGLIGPRVAELDAAAVERLIGAQRHRGPDDEGIERIPTRAGVCCLASRRLAILDLSPAGHMPMADRGTGNVVVYNGEVYNFRALREDLERSGARFLSGTDTEVVLRAYARDGAACLERLQGMFALAIWDEARQELLLARDRAGEKPLYYVAQPGLFAFASEVRALLASGVVDPCLDPDAIAVFLANGFAISPQTLVRGVRSLLPGHWMRVAADGRVIESGAYWLPPAPDPALCDPAALEEHLVRGGELLEEAVTMRLVSDVPLGVFLSGGLDSTCIAAIARRAGGDLRTVSVAFAEKGFDESGSSRGVAAALGTRHTELPLTNAAFWSWMPDVLAGLDQPSFDGANSYCVSRAAKEAGLTVALSGIGADELFGGYPFFRVVPLLDRLARADGGRAGRWARPHVRAWAGDGAALSHLTGAWKVVDLLTHDLRDGKRTDVIDTYQSAQTLFPSWARRALRAGAGVGASVAGDAAFGVPPDRRASLQADVEELDVPGATSLLAWRLFLGERCLRDTDAMSMAVSLEVRAPFTDHRLVEHVLRIPGPLRCAGAPEKRLAWRMMRPYVDGVLPFRRKQGFIFPLRLWLRSPAGVAALEDVFLDERLLHNIGLDAAAVAALWRCFLSAPRSVPWSRVWAVFVFADWCRRYGVHV